MKEIIKNKKIVGIILIMIALFVANILNPNVYAANDSFKTSLSVDNFQVKRGDTFTVTISLSDILIESGEKGIGAYTAKLDFDSSCLEYVSTDGTDKWEAPFYQDKLIIGTTNDGLVVNTSQSIGSITFKVKEDAKLGETTIKLINFYGSTAENDVYADDSSINVTIMDKQGVDENQGDSSDQNENQGGSSNPNENQGGNSNGNSSENGNGNGNGNGSTGFNGNQGGNSGINGSGSTNTNKEGSKGTLPKTGESNIVIYSLISVFTLILLVYGIKMKLLNKRIKREQDKN